MWTVKIDYNGELNPFEDIMEGTGLEDEELIEAAGGIGLCDTYGHWL